SKRQQKLVEVAFQSWKSGLYTDVTFLIDQEKFPAHRLVMVALSDYFTALFKNCEKESGDITLHKISPEDFAIILKFAYTGQVDVTSDNVQSVLIAADYYRIDTMRKECIKFMASYLDVDNVCNVLMFAIEYSFLSLEEKSLSFLKQNWEGIFKTEFFQILDPLYLAGILEDDNLVLYSNKVLLKSADREILALNTVLHFLTHRRIDDPSVCQRLIRAVRFPFIPQDALNHCFATVEMDLHETLRLKEAVEAERVAAEVPGSWSQPRKFTSPEILMYTLSEMNGAYESEIKSFQKFPANFEIHSIDLWIQRMVVDAIGGLQVRYRDPTSGHLCPFKYEQGDCQKSIAHHYVELQKNEFITKVITSGYLIESLGFETNFGLKYGPFGSQYGFVKRVVAPESPFSYLIDIKCDTMPKDIEGRCLLGLKLDWVTFKE
ncbi:unnamed protein product, partial [Lymnaea stagnalis]